MKKTILCIAVLFGGLSIFAQKDTTRIKLGETKIIIIDKETDKKSKSKKEKLEKGKEEFKGMLEEKQDELKIKGDELDNTKRELKEQQEKLNEEQEELQKQELQKEIQEKELQLQKQELELKELGKEIDALEKGIDDIDNELENESNMKNDSDWGKNNKYNWDCDDDEDWDSDWDNLSPFGKNKKFRGHWAGVELGLNNFVNKDYNLSLDPADRNFELDASKSWVFSVNFSEFNIPFARGIGLVTGLGSTWNNYHFRENVNLHEDANGVMIAEAEPVKSYYKNTLNTWSLTMPLIFEIQLPAAEKGSGIYLGFGVVGSARLTSKGKQRYWLNGIHYKEKRKSDFLINTFRYGLTARVGFKYLKFFANYDLVPLFQDERGPEIFPVSVGLTLLSF